MVIETSDINTDPGYNMVTDLDKALSFSSGLGVTMALDHSDLYDPGCSMALGHQHGFRWLT